MELFCSRDLALRLGAVAPETTAHHKALKNAGHLLVRDPETSGPMFWPWQVTTSEMVTSRSS
jgi:hypothetical protein